MNFLSRFKKIFLVSVFLFCIFSLSSVVLAKTKITHGYQVDNKRVVTVYFEEDAVNLYTNTPLKTNGTAKQFGVNSLGKLHKEGLESAYEEAGVDFSGIDTGSIYYNRSPSGVTYIEKRDAEDGGDRIVAISTQTGLFIPDDDFRKDSEGGQKFFETVDAASGYTKGKISQDYAYYDKSPENINNQEKELGGLQEQEAAQKKKIADMIAAGASPDAIRVEEEKLKGIQAEVAKQQNLVGNLQTKSTDCGITNFFTFDCFLKGLSYIALIVFKLATFVLGLAGSLLDYSIELAINSAEFLEALNIVNPMWTFVRDILNMSFIFILLWIAINMVLGRAGIGSAKTYTIKNDVRNVVLVAILINFSLFFAKMFVDGSNLVTLELYQQMKPVESTVGDGKSGISDQIMNTVGLTSLVSIKDVFDTNTKEFPHACQDMPSVALSVGVFGTIFVLILSVAFGLAAVLFFIRLPNMIYLFISSPLWIWGHVMKGGIFDEAKNSWVKNMFHLCTFPIVYMMWMLAGLFTFKQLLGAKDEAGTFLDVLCNTTDTNVWTKSLSVVLIFCIVIAVMMKAIKYAMDKGAGTSFVAPLANKMINQAGQLQTKMTSGLYNRTVVASANAATNAAANAANRLGGIALAAGKAPLVGAKNLATSTARATGNWVSNGVSTFFGNRAANASSPLMQKILSGTSATFRDPKLFGKTQKEALDERQKRAEENRAKYEKSLKDSGVYKVESEEDWMERTKGDKAAYKKYVEQKAKLIMKSQLGAGVMGYKRAGAAKTTDDQILEDMFEDVIDNNGLKTGEKRFNQGKLWKNIVEARAYHTTGAGKKDISLSTTQSAFFDPDKRRSKGRAAATTSFAKSMDREVNQKERKKVELKLKKETLVQSEIELSNIPTSVIQLDSIINDPAFDAKLYGKDVANYKTKMNKIAALSGGTNSNQNLIDKLNNDADTLAKKIVSGRLKTIEKIDKIRKSIDTLESEV